MTKSKNIQSINRYINYKERFWMRVNVKNEEECWKWLGSFSSTGYGQIVVNGKNSRTHRVSWVLHYGDIPKRLHVLHKCDNRWCVNPRHLYLGTNLDNIKDKISRGRHSKGTMRPMAKLTDEKVRQMRTKFLGGKHTYFEVAKDFNMSLGQTWMIINQKAWKHVF